MKTPVSETDFQDLNLIKRGKVRDIYDLGDNLLMVATDRISAFDVIMPDPIPDKGIILTQISLYWFEIMKPIIENHVVSADVNEYPSVCQPYAETLRERSMLVKKTNPLAHRVRGQGLHIRFRVEILSRIRQCLRNSPGSWAAGIRQTAGANFYAVNQRGTRRSRYQYRF